MGLDDLVGKAKNALSGREEQVKGALDSAARAVKSRTDDSTDRKVDAAVEKAKDAIDRQRTGPSAAPRTAGPRHAAPPAAGSDGPATGTDRPTTGTSPRHAQ